LHDFPSSLCLALEGTAPDLTLNVMGQTVISNQDTVIDGALTQGVVLTEGMTFSIGNLTIQYDNNTDIGTGALVDGNFVEVTTDGWNSHG